MVLFCSSFKDTPSPSAHQITVDRVLVVPLHGLLRPAGVSGWWSHRQRSNRVYMVVRTFCTYPGPTSPWVQKPSRTQHLHQQTQASRTKLIGRSLLKSTASSSRIGMVSITCQRLTQSSAKVSHAPFLKRATPGYFSKKNTMRGDFPVHPFAFCVYPQLPLSFT
jgi:hypothetical protein